MRKHSTLGALLAVLVSGQSGNRHQHHYGGVRNHAQVSTNQTRLNLRLTRPQSCRVILIAGTGRAGTTYLVEQLTLLGAPTGFNASYVSQLAESGGAGLERSWSVNLHMRPDGALVCSPRRRIFKSPYLTLTYKKWINASNIEAVIVPIRDAHGAAHSREVQHAANATTGFFMAGARTEEEQLRANRKMIYDLVYALAAADVPTIYLAYPRHVQDASYAYSKLKDVLEPLDISRAAFLAAHNATYRAGFVHAVAAPTGGPTCADDEGPLGPQKRRCGWYEKRKKWCSLDEIRKRCPIACDACDIAPHRPGQGLLEG